VPTRALCDPGGANLENLLSQDATAFQGNSPASAPDMQYSEENRKSDSSGKESEERRPEPCGKPYGDHVDENYSDQPYHEPHREAPEEPASKALACTSRATGRHALT